MEGGGRIEASDVNGDSAVNVRSGECAVQARRVRRHELESAHRLSLYFRHCSHGSSCSPLRKVIVFIFNHACIQQYIFILLN